MITRIQTRRGTAAAWADANPVLGSGEIGFETDTKKIRVGDGETSFTALPCIQIGAFNVPIVSSGGIADISEGQWDSIIEGTVVTTTDGRRWVYKGTGDKSTEASYIEIGDITPTWESITGKPDFASLYSPLFDQSLNTTDAATFASLSMTAGAPHGRIATYKGQQWFGGVNGSAGILFEGDNTDAAVWMTGLNEAISAYRHVNLCAINGPQLWIDTSGKVLIATDTVDGSSAKLQINGGVSADEFTLRGTGDLSTLFSDVESLVSDLGSSTAAGRSLLNAADAAAQRSLLATSWAAGLLAQNGRTTFSNADYTALSTDRYIAQIGTMSAPRTLTLPSAASVAAGTEITLRDESDTVTRINYITVTRSGSDTISTATLSGNESASTYVYQNGLVAVRFYSDGVSKWIANDGISTGLIHIPFAASGQPSTGIIWGTHGATALSSMSGSITMDGSVGGHNEIRYSAPRQAIVTSLYSSSDVGYLQIGNNSCDGMYMFLSSQGTSTSNRTTCPSAALVFKTNYWTGSAASYRTPTIRGEMDTSGNPRLSFYAAGTTSSGGDVTTTWNANYNGTGQGGRTFDAGTETLRIVAGGLDMLTNKITGLQSGTSASPSITGPSSNTGFGFFGSEFQLTRAGSLLAYSDATYKLVIQDILTCQGRVGLSAGTAGFNAIHRTDDTTTGWHFPASQQIAVATNGVERQRWTNGGIIFTPPASASALSTNGTVTFELTNNTTLTFKARGSDGTTRSGTITLA